MESENPVTRFGSKKIVYDPKDPKYSCIINYWKITTKIPPAFSRWAYAGVPSPSTSFRYKN